MQILNKRHFGAILKARRRTLKLTQRQTAYSSEITKANYSRIESGQAEVKLETAIRILETLGLTLDVMDWTGKHGATFSKSEAAMLDNITNQIINDLKEAEI